MTWSVDDGTSELVTYSRWFDPLMLGYATPTPMLVFLATGVTVIALAFGIAVPDARASKVPIAVLGGALAVLAIGRVLELLIQLDPGLQGWGYVVPALLIAALVPLLVQRRRALAAKPAGGRTHPSPTPRAISR
jgi:hypothetical protein